MEKIIVIPTDTLYGLVAPATDRDAVEQVYKLKNRAPEKPCIILISSIEDLGKFGIEVNQEIKKFLGFVWPGAVSVILPCPHKEFEYLHRGTKTLAFRLPNKPQLLAHLKETGPVIAPSANPEGKKPAESIEEARQYFGDEVEYIDGGELVGKPSTLISIKDGKIEVLRQGVAKLDFDTITEMNKLARLEEEIEKIKERNHRVEADKAWETSKTRTAFISIVTFVLLYLFMILINADRPFLNALVSVIAYWISTETYGVLKKWWLKRRNG